MARCRPRRARVATGATYTIVVAEVEELTSEADPSAAAAALAGSVAAAPGGGGAAGVAAAAAAFWAEYWSRSGVSLPSLPRVADLWGGAQYALAATASADAREVPPALFGVWVTSDEVGWNGDMTLDYNFESSYYSAFSANHAPQFASYLGPILAWQAPARALAARFAAQWNVTCDPSALLFACHLVPNGFSSWDQSVYMLWNGHFAVLPAISYVEYTQDAAFAAATLYPLLDALNALWACALNRSATGLPPPRDYAFHDTRGDEEHEKGVSPDPQIALALASRTLAAQLALAARLGVPPGQVAGLADILGHLAPFNTDAGCSPLPPNKWPCAPFNWTAPDGTLYANLSVWTAYGGAPVHNSDSFSLYPIWPAEAVAGGAALDDATAARAQASARAYARFVGGRPVDVFASAVLAGQGFAFDAATRPGGSVLQTGAGAGAGAAWRAAPAVAYSPLEALEGLQAQMDSPCPPCCPCGPGGRLFGANLLLYTSGGGVENIGVARALAEMLVTAVGGGVEGGAILLFPFWPRSEPAAFAGLLVKGGFAVSASYSNETRAVASPIVVLAQHTWAGAPTGAARLFDPWGGGPGSVAVACGGASVPVAWGPGGPGAGAGVLSFAAPLGVPCEVTRAAGAAAEPAAPAAPEEAGAGAGSPSTLRRLLQTPQ